MNSPDRIFVQWPSVSGCGLAFTVGGASGLRTEYIRREALPTLPEVQAIVDAAVDIARAQAFSAGYEAGEKAEREAIITYIGGRVDHVEDAVKWGGSKHYLQSLKGGVTELSHLAATIRKRGEGEV